ncbi:MAG: hydrogenase nickel incorporation protein HypB [Streptosporangiaceae bacterium]|jgi:hydrogenase nickel incorporation protein HypB
MCATCGCGVAGVRVFGPGQLGPAGHGHGTDHENGHAPGHDHDREHKHRAGHEHEHEARHAHGPEDRTVELQQKVLAKNDRLAEDNRTWLTARGILAVNLMSSPGAGKTTLLERTAREAGAGLGLTVIEGDQETTLDASRIEAAGCEVAQINTGAGCHLDASMVARGLHALDPRPGSVLVIENVGNLVCPALFDLGEAARVVLSSVTEGADKPIKYPQMFRGADLVLLTKVDLLPYVDFDTERHAQDLKLISPGAQILPLSATTGEGLPAWYAWLAERAR